MTVSFRLATADPRVRSAIRASRLLALGVKMHSTLKKMSYNSFADMMLPKVNHLAASGGPTDCSRRLNGGKPTAGRKVTNESSYLYLCHMMDSTTRVVCSAAIQKVNLRGVGRPSAESVKKVDAPTGFSVPDQ